MTAPLERFEKLMGDLATMELMLAVSKLFLVSIFLGVFSIFLIN